MAGTTARLALPFPQLTDPADISQAVAPLTTLLDTIMLAYAKGTHAARPTAAAGNGRIYYETDTGITFFSDGTNWQRLDLDALNRIITLEAAVTSEATARGAADTAEAAARTAAVAAEAAARTAADAALTPTTDTRLGAPGDVVWSAAAARAGCLLCDGTSYLRSAWLDLFTALGGTGSPWGLPDGTHFKVPDLRGRVPLVAGAGAGLTARALAATGGEESHLLLSAETGMVSHGHASGGDVNTGPDTPDHFHAYNDGATAGGGIAGPNSSGWNPTVVATSGASAPHHHLVTDPPTPPNAAANAAQAHNTMPPFAALNAFIKT